MLLLNTRFMWPVNLREAGRHEDLRSISVHSRPLKGRQAAQNAGSATVVNKITRLD